MGKRVDELSALQVRRLTRPGLHFVGGVAGLALQVSAAGARSWILRVQVAGRRRDAGLGSYPEVTLQAARDRAREARDAIRKGVDPAAEKRAARSALAAQREKTMTFKQCAEAYITAHRAGWKSQKHAQQWASTLSSYCFPIFGDLLVEDVGLVHVMAAIEPIWREKTETASRLRGRVECVLDWARGRGLRTGDNPAAWKGNLDAQLPRPSRVAKVVHHPALAVAEVGAFMVRLRQASGMGALALEFAILTAARSGEVRGAVLEEFDLHEKVWTVPPGRMKAGREHRVPLTSQALAVIERALELRNPLASNIVFQGQRGGMLSDMALLQVARRLGVAAVPHGFRSTFRDWASERTNYPREVAEMALAHSIGNAVEAAYRRGDLFNKRRALMSAWAEFLDRPERRGDVVPLRKSKA